MSLKKYVNIFKRIDYMAENHSTGTPKELACKLGVSERQLYNYISDLRDIGYQLEYSNDLGSYFYSNPN